MAHGKYLRLRIAASAVLLSFHTPALRANDDVRQLLERASRNVLDTITRLPRYVCTLTVDRARYEPEERRAHSCDDISAEVSSAA